MDYAFPFSVDVIPVRERWLGYEPHTGVEGMLIGHRARLGLRKGELDRIQQILVAERLGQ